MKSLGRKTRSYADSLTASPTPRNSWFRYEQRALRMEGGAVRSRWPRAVGGVAAPVQQGHHLLSTYVPHIVAGTQRGRPEDAVAGPNGRCADWHGGRCSTGALRPERYYHAAHLQPIQSSQRRPVCDRTVGVFG